MFIRTRCTHISDELSRRTPWMILIDEAIPICTRLTFQPPVRRLFDRIQLVISSIRRRSRATCPSRLANISSMIFDRNATSSRTAPTPNEHSRKVLQYLLLPHQRQSNRKSILCIRWIRRRWTITILITDYYKQQQSIIVTPISRITWQGKTYFSRARRMPFSLIETAKDKEKTSCIIDISIVCKQISSNKGSDMYRDDKKPNCVRRPIDIQQVMSCLRRRERDCYIRSVAMFSWSFPRKVKSWFIRSRDKSTKSFFLSSCRRSWNDLLSQSSPSPSPSSPSAATDSSGNSAVLAPPPANPMHRKPVRIVKAVQRSPPSNGEVLSSNTRPLTSSKTYSLAKPGLFSASPINNSLQKLSNKSTNATRRFQSRDETDLQCSLKEFAARYPTNHSFNELARLTLSDDHHLSTDYTRSLFPIPDRLRRLRSRQSSGGETNSMTTSNSSSFEHISRTVSAEQTIFDEHSLRQAVKKRVIHCQQFPFLFPGRSDLQSEETSGDVERQSTNDQWRNHG